MKLRGQAQEGYAMAALLVAMGIMAVMMTVVMPVWKQSAQREKEAELVFRGKQYVHAIALFQRKYVGAYPPNLKVLVEQRFLRKLYKDPITDDDFQPIPFGQATPGPAPAAGGRQTQSTPSSVPGRAGTPGASAGPGAQPGRGGSTFGSQQITGGGIGIQGVTSKSKDESIRIYNGRTHYNEWQFVYTPPPQRGGGPGVQGGPGQPGQPGQQPGPFGGPGGQRGRGDGRGPGRGFPPGGDGRGFPPGGPGRGVGPDGQQFPQFPQPGQPGGRGRGL